MSNLIPKFQDKEAKDLSLLIAAPSVCFSLSIY